MKALFLYSDSPGNGRIVKKIDYIERRLMEIFPTHVTLWTSSIGELEENAKKACREFDVLLFAGGDGTFNRIINAIASETKRPILGYISSGTLSDFGRNFGIGHNIRKSLNIIQRGKIQSFDIGCINQTTFFTYIVAIGTFSEISYSTKRIRLRKFGKLAYYVNAVKDAIIPHHFEVNITIDGVSTKHVVPFFLLLNSRYVGGFSVNFTNEVDDGKFDVYLTKPGLFNGLLNYALGKRKTDHYRVDRISVHPEIDTPWCIDGEKGIKGNIEIVLLKKHLTIFTK